MAADTRSAARRPSPPSVEAYLAALPDVSRAALARVRDTIRRALPAVEESISYGIPTFRLHGRAVVYCAAFTAHYSVYPATRFVIDAVGDALAPGDYNGKGTIRFPLDRPVPVRLVARIAKLRAAEEAARSTTRQRAAKKR